MRVREGERGGLEEEDQCDVDVVDATLPMRVRGGGVGGIAVDWPEAAALGRDMVTGRGERLRGGGGMGLGGRTVGMEGDDAW